jgi:hypothetical protein
VYTLWHDIPWEGWYQACSGSLEDIKRFISVHPDLKPCDLCITEDTNIDVYKFCSEARKV